MISISGINANFEFLNVTCCFIHDGWMPSGHVGKELAVGAESAKKQAQLLYIFWRGHADKVAISSRQGQRRRGRLCGREYWL